MNFPRRLSVLLMLLALSAMAGNYFSLEIPTARWLFSFGDKVGWYVSGTLFFLSIIIFFRTKNFSWNPVTERRFRGFKAIRRGYISWLLLLGVVVLTLPDHLLVGNRALAVKYQGKWFFPALLEKNFTPNDFGQTNEGNVDYRELQKTFSREAKSNQVILPIVPWNSTFDSDQLLEVPISQYQNYSGMAVAYFPNTKIKRHEVIFRKGKLQGRATYFNQQGEPIAEEVWQAGHLMGKKKLQASDDDTQSEIDLKNYVAKIYPPLPPSLQTRHLLGTDSRGWDIAAQLYGGLQVSLKATLLYLVLTFGIGITIGLISGYFGGVFDLIAQRIIEIISNVPFLFLVMIIAAQIGREQISIATIVVVMCLFSWIGISTYQRAAALREKSRDYAAAAKVMGASTTRILFHHILPNALSTIITQVPFSVTGVVTSLTALDFIGFGLPEKYPSWGTLLADGLANFSSPWIVSSVFVILVLLLLLVTFVGEAIREAFDPKKFTTYE